MTLNVVAIDGPVGSGKSTVARALAKALEWSFLDTGAMYRAITVEARRRGIDPHDVDAVGDLAERADIETLPKVTVDGNDVSEELRSSATNESVSVVAAQPRVRAAMVDQQRKFAARQPNGTVVEGRDITTVVFPDARLKVFLTASVEERTRRRGDEDASSIRRRDEIDATRAVSPLRHAQDAKMIDTTGRSVDDVVREILTWLSR
jgi:cytidylate kinase